MWVNIPAFFSVISFLSDEISFSELYFDPAPRSQLEENGRSKGIG